MKRFFTPLMVLCALTLGGFVGFQYANRRYDNTLTDTIASHAFNRASGTFTTLRDLRSGDTNSVFDSLERDLDVGVMSLRGILDDVPTIEHAANYTNLLRRIAEYRSVHPHRSEVAEIATSVSEILAQVRKGSP